MKLHRNIIWLVPLVLLITFPLWSIPVGTFLTPRGGFDPDIKKGPVKDHDFNMETVRITQNQNGRKTAFIRAASGSTGDNPDILLMEEVDADIFDEEGNITKVIARRGKYNTATELLILIDDVVVDKTSDNQKLYTDLLHYDNIKRTVHCPGPTRVEGNNVTIDGGNLNYDIQTQTYQMSNGVLCVVNNYSVVPEPEPGGSGETEAE